MPVTVSDGVHVVGCDVAKQTVVVFDSVTQTTKTLDNRPQTLRAFIARLSKSCLIVCEATGGYETPLLTAAREAGVPAHRADARKVKAFIRSHGTLAKTDAIDAKGLAQYGLERYDRLDHWQPPSKIHQDIQRLVQMRTQLVKQRTALRNQITAPGGDSIRPYLDPVLDAVETSIQDVNAALEALVAQDPDIAKTVAIISRIPGCGPVTAITVTALMPELGRISGRQAASLANLAPHPNQSGRKDGYRRTRGGRPEVKHALFMAAMSARNHHKKLRAFYERLIKNGKKRLVALTALMRKLITIINAQIRDSRIKQPAPI